MAKNSKDGSFASNLPGVQPISDAAVAVMDKTREAAMGLKDRVVAMMPDGVFSKNIDLEYSSLRDLYIKELEDLYSAEHQLLKALPKMAAAAASARLRTAFEMHLKETQAQVERLKKVFDGLGMTPKAHKCKAMEGLVAEGDEWMKESAKPGVRDAGLIAAAQRVEHYEMAGYGCVRTYAKLLGDTKAVALLQATLDEEGAADKKLTQLAKRINVSAETGEVESAEVRNRKRATKKPSKAAPRRKAAK